MVKEFWAYNIPFKRIQTWTRTILDAKTDVLVKIGMLMFGIDLMYFWSLILKMLKF